MGDIDLSETALEQALPEAFEVIRRDGACWSDPSALADTLYRDWYCQAARKPPPEGGDRDLSELLRVSHAGSAVWETGWRIANLSSKGRVAVSRGRERRVVHVIDCIPDPSAANPDLRVGETISVVARRDSHSMNPGDWVTFSDTWHASRAPRVRIYWNIASFGAARLVNVLTGALDPALPFLFKCPRRPSEFDRLDAAVLYLPRDGFARAAPAIARAAAASASALGDDVPRLTKRLAAGVGLAEDPPGGTTSFGTARCNLVARAVAECLAAGRQSPRDWTGAVLAGFAAAGVPAERPWAETAASRDYALP